MELPSGGIAAGNLGSVHAAHTNRQDWWLNPGQEYLDGAGHLGHLTWLGLDLLVSLLGLET